jgi:acylphosphatase
VSTLHVAVRGRVQGVGFRWFVRERARALRLRGWVRNLEDGGVEVLADGSADAIAGLREALQRGPSGAHVHAIDDLAEAPKPPLADGFNILR